MGSRAAYLSRLRRAFLIRVHPDRLHSFRDSDLRAQQSATVQAIIQRLQETDVSAWQSGRSNSTPILKRNATFKTVKCLVIPSSQNAAVLTAKLRLGGNVDDVLTDMAKALRESGATEIPMPTSSTPLNHNAKNTTSVGDSGRSYQTPPRLKGRVLKEFLSSIELSIIEDRKLARIEAHAVASSVRNAFGFAAVDATKIGWSSKSVVVLLRRLLSLHAEFASHTRPSFYPWKLSFSSAVNEEGVVDEYSGKILLNPSGTNVQWLRGLQAVTDATNSGMLQTRAEIEEWTTELQKRRGIRLRKGFTCNSRAYHYFMKDLIESIDEVNEPSWTNETLNLPRIDGVDAVVEDMLVCIRPEITKTGSIMLGSHMTATVCMNAFSRLSYMARDRRSSFKEDKIQSREMARYAQNVLGLERISFDERTLAHDDFRNSVNRLMTTSNELQVSGHLLRMVATDRFCYIGDDGALVIPHNWC